MSAANTHDLSKLALIGSATLPNGSFTVFDKAAGNGIKLDAASPAFGFRDMLGPIVVRGTGSGNPPLSVYRGSIREYEFTAGTLREAWISFHVPHDYVPGTDIYIHAHWSQVVVDTITNVAVWNWDITYADGYGTPGGAGDPFVAPKTISAAPQLVSTTQYGHMISEVIITGATDTATTFDRTKPKVDGLFLVRVYRNNGLNGDTLGQNAFLHFSDMHYQSSGLLGTKNKNSPFYS